MTVEKTVKWLGLICILAGIARMGMTPAGLIFGSDSKQELAFALAASILMGISSINLFLAQAKKAGVFGLIAALLLAVGNIILAGGFYGFFAYGELPKPGTFVNMIESLAYPGLLLGTLILMIVTYRANLFPRWYIAIFALMLLSLGIPFLGDYFAFFWGLTYAAMGYTIFTEKYVNPSVTIKSKKSNAVINE
ncbi:hypothetical protein [Neobacillus cucumis]|uniref:Uncharacterized protein n=1 Tax=Neobacillus cucumis TaxID=1740721 RepID=A0A2N5HJE4_9BACI|nr:hypothetical protein [Neobacillus cucumis]PLS05621.1 hypothetical protein CVD27_09670 [Neobacillus cucumis]